MDAHQTAVSAEDMERRARYLKEQRDRIVAKKKAEREQKLQKYQEDSRDRTNSGKITTFGAVGGQLWYMK